MTSNPIPRHISRQNFNSKRCMQPYVHIHNSQDMESTETSISRWMDKDVVRIHNGIPFSHKKERHNAMCSNMDANRDHHTKWSQRKEEDSIRYGFYVKPKIWHKWIYLCNRVTDIESILVVAKEERVWEEGQSRRLGIYRMNEQQGATVQHRALYSVSYDKP